MNSKLIKEINFIKNSLTENEILKRIFVSFELNLSIE